MHPVLFAYGPLRIHAYGLLVALGVLVAISMLRRSAPRIRIEEDQVVDLALGVVFFGFLGARIFYVLLYWDYFKSSPLEALMIWKGGIVLYGGQIGGLLGLFAFTRIKKVPFLKCLDLLLPAVAITQGFGRLGCFLNGCCYGIKSNLPWAVQFPFLDHAVHPTQLYEALFCFALGGILFWLWRRNLMDGLVSFSYFSFYALGRFFIEFLRGDNPKMLFDLTLPQWVSLWIVGLAAIVYFLWIRNAEKRIHRTE